MRPFAQIMALAAALVFGAVPAAAQTYPSKQITMIVPFAAGGAYDIVGRIIAPRMSELLGQTIVIENVTGAGGIAGSLRAANAAPDGYTLLLGHTGTHAYNQWMYKRRRYDAINDFTPVALFSEQPLVLEVRKDLPAKNLGEFIALLKSNGAKMQYGSAGVGSTTHLACTLLNSRIGVTIAHVPYRGSAPAANDLMTGAIDYLCGNLGSALPRIQSGHEKALAIFSKERTPLLPELPTAHEQGLPDFEVTTWAAFFLPKGAPRDIVDKLNAAAHGAMDSPDTKKRMNDAGAVGVAPERRSPEYLAKYMAEEIARWEEPIVKGGMQVD